MKISVKKMWGKWTLEIKQGVQTFNFRTLDTTEEEYVWTAKMFRKALKNHNKELIK